MEHESNYISGSQKELLGKFLVAKSVIKPDLLQQALERQKNDNRTIGTILNRCFQISQDVIDSTSLELIERLAESILNKQLRSVIEADDGIGKAGVDVDQLFKIIKSLNVTLPKSEIKEVRTFVKENNRHVPDKSHTWIQNIQGEMDVQVSLMAVESEIHISTPFDYDIETSELKIFTSGLLSGIRSELIPKFEEFRAKRANILSGTRRLKNKVK